MANLMLRDMAHGALDFTYRMLGRREKVRVGAVVVYCYEKFQENINAGQQPRQDGFFDDAPNDRSADKEIFEGVMLVAQREPQEKKLQFLGNLVANLAFDQRIDKAHAQLLVKVAEDVSYRQLCILSLFAQRDLRGIRLRQGDYRIEKGGGGSFSVEMVGLLQEIHDLCQRQMLTD